LHLVGILFPHNIKSLEPYVVTAFVSGTHLLCIFCIVTENEAADACHWFATLSEGWRLLTNRRTDTTSVTNRFRFHNVTTAFNLTVKKHTDDKHNASWIRQWNFECPSALSKLVNLFHTISCTFTSIQDQY